MVGLWIVWNLTCDSADKEKYKRVSITIKFVILDYNLYKSYKLPSKIISSTISPSLFYYKKKRKTA